MTVEIPTATTTTPFSVTQTAQQVSPTVVPLPLAFSLTLPFDVGLTPYPLAFLRLPLTTGSSLEQQACRCQRKKKRAFCSVACALQTCPLPKSAAIFVASIHFAALRRVFHHFNGLTVPCRNVCSRRGKLPSFLRTTPKNIPMTLVST